MYNDVEILSGGGKYFLDNIQFKRLGIFPGTFDPVHEGHIKFALDVYNSEAFTDKGIGLILFFPHIFATKKTPSILRDRQEILEEMICRNPELGLLKIPENIQQNFSKFGNPLNSLVNYLKTFNLAQDYVRLMGIDRVESGNLDLFEHNYCGTRGQIPKIQNQKLTYIPSVDLSSTQIRDGEVSLSSDLASFLEKRVKRSPDFALGLNRNLY